MSLSASHLVLMPLFSNLGCLGFFKYILLITLLQLSHSFFSPLFPSTLYLYSLQHSPPPHLSSCPCIAHVSSLASPISILFLTSPCAFYAYHLCFLFPVLFIPVLPIPLPPIILHVISVSVILFLFLFV